MKKNIIGFVLYITLIFLACTKVDFDKLPSAPVETGDSSDITAPVISIPAPNPAQVELNSDYYLPTVTASDDVDGDISARVTYFG